MLFLSFFGNKVFAQKFKAILSGSNEVHNPLTTAKGEVWGRLDGNSLTVWGWFSDLQGDFDDQIAGGSHIHLGYAGSNGGIEFGLTPTLDMDNRGGMYDSTKNTFTLSNQQVTDLKNRMLYVNIHTKYSAAGELRAQFVPADAKVYQVIAYGSNQAHQVLSDGGGSFLLDLIGNDLTVTGSFWKLEGDFDASIAGGIHLHNGMAGTNGGVEVILDATTAMDLRSGTLQYQSNSYTLTSTQVEMLDNRELYLNIHTKAHAMGELRGQVVPQTHVLYRTFLSGSNETPFATTRAMGMATIEYWDDTMTVTGGFSGLSSAADTALFGGCHIHTGYAGQNGGVDLIIDVTYSEDLMSGTFEAKNNWFVLSETQKEKLWNRMLYMNLHSKKHGGGELRGQLLPLANYYFNAELNGAQEPHNVLSTGMGKAQIEVKGMEVTLTGSFSKLKGDFDAAIAGGSHLHKGLAGMSGGIAVELEATTDMDLRGGVYESSNNWWEVSQGLLDSMKMRWHYLNIHTKAVAAGELRGQLLPEATTYLFSKLSGTSEAPSINSEGSGTAIVEIRGDWMGMSGSFANLGSEFDVDIAGGAHIHAGLPGMNGGIWTGLKAQLDMDKMSGRFELMDNNWMLATTAIDSLLMRMGYINIHTKGVASGELRGQLLNMANAYFTTNLSGINQTQVVDQEAWGAIKFELNGDWLTAVGSFDGLSSTVATELAGGAHIHKAANGENGGIELILKLELDDDEMGATFWPDSNTFMIDEDLWKALEGDMLYVNVHSDNYNAGALRGQIHTDINWAPNADADITSPIDASMLVVVGLGSKLLDIEWDPATDNDDDALTYIYQLSVDSDFENISYWTYAGANTKVSLTYSVLDSILLDLGVLLNAQATVYHRIVSLDGSDHRAGESSSVIMTRGLITSIDDQENVLANGSVALYPNLVNDHFQIDFDLDDPQMVSVRIFSIRGEQIQDELLDVQAGRMTRTFDVDTLSPGNYWVSVRGDGFTQSYKLVVVE